MEQLQLFIDERRKRIEPESDHEKALNAIIEGIRKGTVRNSDVWLYIDQVHPGRMRPEYVKQVLRYDMRTVDNYDIRIGDILYGKLL